MGPNKINFRNRKSRKVQKEHILTFYLYSHAVPGLCISEIQALCEQYYVNYTMHVVCGLQ